MLDQVSVLFDLWPESAEWFVIGGVADGLEAQAVKLQFPNVQCIGFEPQPRYVAEQRSLWFHTGYLHEMALWSARQTLEFALPVNATPKSAGVLGLDRPDLGKGREWQPATRTQVQADTLDNLSEQYGPFTNAVLWLDVEGAEVEALKGARRLLESGQVLLANVETFAHTNLPEVNRLLDAGGLILERVWNIGREAGRDAQDYIYRRRSSK